MQHTSLTHTTEKFHYKSATMPVTGLAVLILLLASCSQPDTLFTALSPSRTNIKFANNLEKQDHFNILYYIYYYNGGGVATGDINNDGLVDIYFTANSKGNNKLYLNKGNLPTGQAGFKFEDITATAGVAGNSDWCSGVTMADVNGDGWLDIYVSAVSNFEGLQGRNELFINNGPSHSPSGEVTFTESAVTYGLDFSGFSTQAAFFDYDRDGDLDCYLLNQSHRPNENIVDTSYRRKIDPYAGDRLYRNDMNAGGKFTDVSLPAGILQSNLGYGLGLAIADMNHDGWDDIYIGNDFHENDYYYINNGPSPSLSGEGRGEVTFTESSAEYFSHYSRFSMGNDIADYNNDGQPDIITVDMLPPDEKVLKTYGSDENPDIYQLKITRNGFQDQYSRNCLQQNNGNGSSFSETALLNGVAATDWSWSPLFADFDNDGYKDLFISSGIVKRPSDLDYIKFVSNLYRLKTAGQQGNFDEQALEKMPDGSSYPFLFKGHGDAPFTEVSRSWGTADMKGYYTGASYADLDNDGDLDIIINAINAPAVILKNNSTGSNYISLSFQGDSGNRMGVGCKVWLFHQGKQQYQQLMFTRGFQSSSDTRMHFGLGSAAVIDSLLVVWPGQQYQVLKNIPAGQLLTLDHKNAAGHFDHAVFFSTAPGVLQDITATINCNWKHRENAFIDFNVQYLIPHAQSTRGPKIAVGDVNADGWDDFYACGAKGQPGSLMMQQPNGSFKEMDTALFAADAACEDVDAVFFDANGDGAADLYVVSGGNEYTGEHKALCDRLYINDGKGHFTKAVDNLPAIFQNKSCIAVADVDNDGDRDIFTGTLADARAFGIPQTSYLLLNDGKGKFSLASPDIIPLKDLGMVTAGRFADIDKDGYQDLVVAGEWMPLTIFMNRKGKFEKQEIPHTTGLWQTLMIDDVNADGNPDLLAGNWGYNNKFSSGKDGPLKLYAADFDGNGQTEQLLSYTLNGIEYPFLAKDEVERPLPLLRKHYLLYADYAGVPMQEVFYGWIDTIKPLLAERLGSAICYGNGDGSFIINDLPAALQKAPVFAFQKIDNVHLGNAGYLCGGNFFDVIPYEGRYDAQSLVMFSPEQNNSLKPLPQPGLARTKGQVRDIKKLKTRQGYRWIVARNNSPLLFYAAGPVQTHKTTK